jgi:hypothetical protein
LFCHWLLNTVAHVQLIHEVPTIQSPKFAPIAKFIKSNHASFPNLALGKCVTYLRLET